jgi:signal transduction histidine kinase
MIAAQEEERRRIARELHDSLGQQLTVAKIVADGIMSPESKKRAAEVSELISEAIQQVRTISHLLHPPLLDEIGLEAAIRWYLDELTKRSGIETSLDIQPSDFPRLPQEFENTVYRIIQEAVTNAFRHSGTRKVTVTLTQIDGRVALAIRDYGKGIPQQVAECRPGTFGVGVGGMKQRVKRLGGELKLANAEPGTLLEAIIPYKSEPSAAAAS